MNRAVLIVILQKIAGKLLERSSVTAYLVGLLAVFGVKDPDVSAQVAGYLATAGGIVLFVLNDATLGNWIRGKAISPQADVVEPKPITVPEPISTTAADAAPVEVTSMSLITSLFGGLAKLSPIVQVAVQAVTLVEAIAPTSPGVQKLQAAQAYVGKALGSAEDFTSTIEGVLASLKAVGAITSSPVAAAVEPVPVAAVQPVA